MTVKAATDTVRPSNWAVLIPAGVRAKIYQGLRALAVAEGVVIALRPDMAPLIVAVFTIAQVFGFTVARVNVPKQ